MSDYDELLNLLQKHVSLFEELADLQQVKLEAAQRKDTAQLEECMKKEQASTLALRGFDKKRIALQKKMSLEDISLRNLIPQLPQEFQQPYREAFEQLSSVYQRYQTTASCAREMIEVNIYKIELLIEELKKKANLSDTDIYSADGTVVSQTINRKDMKI